ncbi:alpha/beta hydrolase [Flavivirga algicola]|uniref:Alpha/beta hydrolase n=1 Tax=Flavivirga algicola TaxID=2729136 RepID=A0ABX1RW17_9FLAO|nr:alpha/beta hydrolase [Flavivirga algicola]NMH86868.1 alpha/beta hydrolase [Flavivirga algicola]
MKRAFFLIIISVFFASCSSIKWQPEDDKKLYRKAISRVQEIEPYSNFLKNEKKYIKDLNDAYYQIRWSYIRYLYYDNPKVPKPEKALKKFTESCLRNNLLSKNHKEFYKSANILGFELISDAPTFTVNGNSFRSYRNLTYSTVDRYSQKLDLFMPLNTSGESVPCVIFIHGGGLAVHKRAWMEGHAQYFASNGVAAATIDYRMLNAVDNAVDCVRDTKAAVRWVRANAKRYGINPDQIGASGGSAGAMLSVILATTNSEKVFEGYGGNQSFSSKIQAAAGFATPALTGVRYSWPWTKGEKPDWYDQISPYRFISPDDAPVLLLHGDNDKLVSPLDAKDLCDRFTENNVSCELEFLENKGHVFYMNTKTAHRALMFFKKIFDDSNLKD